MVMTGRYWVRSGEQYENKRVRSRCGQFGRTIMRFEITELSVHAHTFPILHFRILTFVEDHLLKLVA